MLNIKSSGGHARNRWQLPAGGVPRACRNLVAMVAVLAFSGCSTLIDGHPDPVTDPNDELMALQPLISAQAAVECLSRPSEECRNRLVGGRMMAADLRFSQFEERLFRENRRSSVGGSLASLGLSAAATASTGGTAQGLSALSTLLQGSRDATRRELMADNAAMALHAAMRSKRTEIAQRLRAGLRGTIGQYPVAIALADVEDYRSAGNLLSALVALTETVGREAKQQQSELQKLEFTFSDYARRDAQAEDIATWVCGGRSLTACRPEHVAQPMRDKLDACYKEASPGAALQSSDELLYQARKGFPSITAEKRRTLLDCLKKP